MTYSRERERGIIHVHVGDLYFWDLKVAYLFLSVRQNMEDGSWLQGRLGNVLLLCVCTKEKPQVLKNAFVAVSATDLYSVVSTSGPG